MRKQRMVCADIVESGAFTALPPRAQALYVHMMMFADDDGVVDNQALPMLSCKANAKDLDALLNARFVLRAGRVLVIKHWWVHNQLKRDRHHWTRWVDDMEAIYVRPDRVYTDHEGGGAEPFLDGMGAFLGL